MWTWGRLFNLSDLQISYSNITYFSGYDEKSLRQWVDVQHLPQHPAHNLSSTNTCPPAPGPPKKAAHRVHKTRVPTLISLPSPPTPTPPLFPDWKSREAQTSNLECSVEDSPINHSRLDHSLNLWTHFLINFLLSGFTFISSKCYSLSSAREFMLASSIHLPTSAVNSYPSKELIFLKECLFFLVNKLHPSKSLRALPTPPLQTYWTCTWKTGYLSLSLTVVFPSTLISAFPYQFAFVS